MEANDVDSCDQRVMWAVSRLENGSKWRWFMWSESLTSTTFSITFDRKTKVGDGSIWCNIVGSKFGFFRSGRRRAEKSLDRMTHHRRRRCLDWWTVQLAMLVQDPTGTASLMISGESLRSRLLQLAETQTAAHWLFDRQFSEMMRTLMFEFAQFSS